MKIANIKIQFTKECTEELKPIITTYWKLNETFKFETKPGIIKRSFNIEQSELSKLIAHNSALIYYLLCPECNSYEMQKSKSQADFTNKVATLNSRYRKYQCLHCEELNRKNKKIERENKITELNLRLNEAIDSKNWRSLSPFDMGVLKNCIQLENFYTLKKHYWRLLDKQNYHMLFMALRTISSKDLIILETNSLNQKIENYRIINRLKEEFEYNIEPKNLTESTVTYNNETNEIKFKLTINDKQNHPDSPLYAGTVIFKEKIVIEPNVEYIFGQWQRANNNLYLTLTPIENMDKLPTQKRISKHPISLQKGITDFLNNMGKNLRFE